MKKVFVVFILLLAVLDRLSKIFIQSRPGFYSGGIVKLELFKNSNFYFFSFGNYTNLIISLISLFALIVFIFLLFKHRGDFLLFSGILLIALGGASNLLDRLYYGYVIDFIKISALPFSIFNLADVMIVLGIILAISSAYRKQNR